MLDKCAKLLNPARSRAINSWFSQHTEPLPAVTPPKSDDHYSAWPRANLRVSLTKGNRLPAVYKCRHGPLSDKLRSRKTDGKKSALFSTTIPTFGIISDWQWLTWAPLGLSPKERRLWRRWWVGRGLQQGLGPSTLIPDLQKGDRDKVNMAGAKQILSGALSQLKKEIKSLSLVQMAHWYSTVIKW